jgi:quinol monooxygenase YgiN
VYGLIVKLTATAGRRAELIDVLGGDNSQAISGCLSFVSAEDNDDDDVLWVTEVWASEASHKASLELPPSKSGLPPIETLVAGYERVAVTKPVEKHSHPLHGETQVVTDAIP